MGILSQEILEVADLKNISCSVIEDGLTKLYKQRLFDKFLSDDYKGFGALWEYFKSDVGFQNPDGWRFISDFAPTRSAILFFDEQDDKDMLVFADSKDIVDVIGDCTGFVFYLTNKSLNFINCFNDHNFLIATGDSEQWLQNLENTIKEKTH